MLIALPGADPTTDQANHSYLELEDMMTCTAESSIDIDFQILEIKESHQITDILS